MNYTEGSRVQRIEDRPQVLATVVSIDEGGALLLEYDEGGQGWWPAECLEPAPGEA
jgi:hypothetical protein